jgi:hypothetical protein
MIDSFEPSEIEKPAIQPQYVPLTDFKSLNIENELLEQYNRARKLLQDAEFEDGTGLNQKAQVLNSITSILAAITKMQSELYDVERVKILEGTLIDVLLEFPEVKDAFLTRYRKALNV